MHDQEEGELHRTQAEAEKHELRPKAPSRALGAEATRLMSPTFSTKKSSTSSRRTNAAASSGVTPAAAEPGRATTLRSLPAPYECSKVTCQWLAWFVYQKFWLLTPLDRIRRDLAERGIPLAMGTIVSLIARAADLFSGIDGLHWKHSWPAP